MNDCVQFWEFELETAGAPSVVTSNSTLVNILYSAFASNPEHVVTKIKADENLFVSILSKGEVAKKTLMENYATGKIKQDLQPMEDFSVISCKFNRVQLVQTGIVLCDNGEGFSDVQNDAETTLQQLENIEERLEINFSQSSMLKEGEGIISQQITPYEAEEIVKSLFHLPLNQPPTINQESNLSAIASSSRYSPIDTSTTSTNQISTSSRASVQGACGSSTVEIVLRDYQEELCEPGLQGRNCIVVAPTGSGKTFVAAKICQEHIKNTPNAKVLMLVPRVPLVKQQADVFTKFLGDIVHQICGDKSSGIPSSFIKKHVVSVMTAEILLNNLKSKEMKIEDFSLLIFDECHHTMKNSVYNRIMWIYMDKKLSGNTSSCRFPQILGLTASPGVGKVKTEAKAEESIQTLMANLDVDIAPVQAVRCRSSLKHHQTEADEVTIPIPRNPADLFSLSIKGAMQEIEKLMEKCRDRFYNVIGDLKLDNNATYESQEYEAYVVNLLNQSKLVEDEDASRWFMGCASHLRQYNTALNMNDHVKSLHVREYLDDVLFEKLQPNDVDKELRKIYNKYNPVPENDTNLMLEELRLILVAQYNVKPESRSLVFVKTRAIAQALANYLQEESTIEKLKVDPRLITGANKRAEALGMNLNQQENNIKAFQEGVCKVLVTTSVAEEGLDIEKCNLVVGYNYSTNEIGRVQRKGRGRAKDSKYVLLALDDSGHLEREQSNQIRVEIAHSVMQQIQTKDANVLKSEILALQRKLYEERVFKSKANSIRAKEIEDKSPYKISCVGCKRQVTTADLFRHINGQHHVIVDPAFKTQATIKAYDTFEEIKIDEYLTARIYCGNPECDTKWGTRMLYTGAPIFVLKIANFIISNDDGYKENIKKWSKVPFKAAIKPLDLSEYMETMVADGIVDEEDMVIYNAL